MLAQFGWSITAKWLVASIPSRQTHNKECKWRQTLEPYNLVLFLFFSIISHLIVACPIFGVSRRGLRSEMLIPQSANNFLGRGSPTEIPVRF